jgi:hypothetical protein
LGAALIGSKFAHVNTATDAWQQRKNPATATGTSDHDPLYADFDLSKVFKRAG